MILDDPSVGVKLEQLNAQYQFKDGIPKVEVVVKTRDDISRKELETIKYGLMQFVNDKGVYVDDRFSVEEFFKMMSAPTTAYAYFMSIMILTLAFFMMIVSFSQKMKELTWEQGVLRSIGLTQS